VHALLLLALVEGVVTSNSWSGIDYLDSHLQSGSERTPPPDKWMRMRPRGHLQTLIEDDLACSPFSDEGHRKVWARLRISGVRTSRRRVLRLMREHGLLSPCRVRRGTGTSHEGRITTDAPGLMWGTDGTRVLTAEEGMCWIFVAVDHFNCEVVGRHVCKHGDRFAALQPVAQGLLAHFGGVTADAGRGLSLRMDNGT
jgi:putative transposase